MTPLATPNRIELVEPCETCAHALVEPQPGADNLLCREPRALRAYQRERVSARMVRDFDCRRQWYRERT